MGLVSDINLSMCTFLHGYLFVMIEEKVAWYLSSLYGVASCCFSQKFTKGGGLLDICMLASLLPKTNI